MARRVYVHIGLPKTGTTFLQTTMWHNRALMRERGVLYPGSRRMDHYHATLAVRATRRESPEAEPAWQRIVEDLRDWDGTGLVTHEFFCLLDADEARAMVEALAPAEVHVVVTVRDYVRQFPAVWQEWLKITGERSFDDFLAAVMRDEVDGPWTWRTQDVPAILARWEQAVPRERIQVVTVPPRGAPRDLLWRRWCEAVGLDDTGFDRDVSFPNESLGAAQAALVLRLKKHLTGELTSGPVRHRWVRKYFGHEVLVPQGGATFGPRPDDVAMLRERSAEAARELAQRGYAVVGDLDELVPAADLPVLPNPGDVDDTELLEVALRAIDTMIHDVRGLTQELDARPPRRGTGGRRPWPRRLRALARRGRAAARRARRARTARRS